MTVLIFFFFVKRIKLYFKVDILATLVMPVAKCPFSKISECIDFIIHSHRFHNPLNECKLISITLKKQDVMSNMMELTKKYLYLAIGWKKKMEGTKLKE